MPRSGPSSAPGRWLSRNVLTLGLVSLFTDLSTEMGYSIVPVFLKDVLKTSPALIAESTPPEYYGRSNGFHKTLDNLGAVLLILLGVRDIAGKTAGQFRLTLLPANLLMGVLWQKIGFRGALLVGAGHSLCAGLMLVNLVRPPRGRARAQCP